MNADCKPADESQKASPGRRGFNTIFNTLFRFRKRSLPNAVAGDSSASYLTNKSSVSEVSSTCQKQENSSSGLKSSLTNLHSEQSASNRFVKSTVNLQPNSHHWIGSEHEAPSDASSSRQLSAPRRISSASDRSAISSPERPSFTSGLQRRSSAGASSVVTLHYQSSLRTFRNLDKDLEALRLSRHDNPILQRKMMRSYVREPEVAFSRQHQSDETLILKPVLLDPACGGKRELVTPYDYHPLNVIQQHLVRSPPPYINTLRQFGYDVGGLRATSSSEIEREHAKSESATCTCVSQSYSVHAEEIQRAPLPHVRQSCPMFRPLLTMQKGMFHEHREHKKQPKDLRPLLSFSSDDVIEAESYSMTRTHRRHFEAVRQNFNIRLEDSESTANSPSIHVVTRKNRRALHSRHPVAYPLQKTI